MEEINLDLNNLFNLSYNFEGLKILLTSIAKNQERMMEKIKNLENASNLRGKIVSQNIPQIKTQLQPKDIKEISSSVSKDDKDNSNNYLITDLENRVSNLENNFSNLRNFIPQYEESKTLNEILDEHTNNLNDLNDNIKGINTDMKNMKEDAENIKIKVMDFSLLDAFKDKNITADIDAAELLIKSLENKINEKFKFVEEKIKKDEGDIFKLKTDIINIKNASNFQTKNLSYLKEEILSLQKSLEQQRTNTLDNINQNKELVRKLREKINSNNNNINSSITSINDKVKDIEEKIQKMFENLGKNIQKEGKIEAENLEKEFVKNEDFMFYRENTHKRYIHLEKKIQMVSDSIKTKELEDKIYLVEKEIKNKKPDESEFFSLNEQVQSHQDFLDSIKIENTNTQNDLKKLKETINLINRKCEDLILQNLMSAKMPDDSKESKARQNLMFAKLEEYVELSVFNEYLIDNSRDKEKIRKEIDSLKQFKEEMIETLKKSASIIDLKNLESYLEDIIDEFKDKMFKLCPRKSEITKALKNMELQIRSLYDLIMKKEEKSETWMLAKKPIGCFACASCENYIGELKENDEKVFWNQFPEYGPIVKELNINKIGNGFSRILNLVDFNKDKNENDKTGKTLSIEDKDKNNSKDTNDKIKNIFNETGYKNSKKTIFRNINIETNLKTMPSFDEVRIGNKTQRLQKISIDEIKSKNNELNNNLPAITSRNENDIYENGKQSKDGPKLIKIFKKKK
jgi:chromosome segregation ATPase